MKRRISTAVTLLTALMMVMVMSASAFAEGVIGNNAALNAALKNAGLKESQVKHIEVDYESDDNTYEIEFTTKKKKTEYSFDINAETGKIIEKSVDYRYKKNTSHKKIGKKAARKKVAKKAGVSYKVVKSGTCTYKYKGRKGVYKLRFNNNGIAYEYELLAPTGKIIEYEWKVVG